MVDLRYEINIDRLAAIYPAVRKPVLWTGQLQGKRSGGN